mmetsp:Transcript_20797/g.44416  ORF Transcript_20797/g.44416 Transcript_20797/m.44416 type:complete len:772 (+) Transcript_20797:74-2389(+)
MTTQDTNGGGYPGKSAREAQLEEEVERLHKLINEMKGAQKMPAKSHSENSEMSVAVSLAPEAEDIEQVLMSASESEASRGSRGNAERSQSFHDSDPTKNHSAMNHGHSVHRPRGFTLEATTNVATVLGSALAMTRVKQAIIYTIALAGVGFVLVARASGLGEDDDSHHRILGGDASVLLINIAFCLTSAGMIAFFVNLFSLPLILGYLLGGVLVGPIGLDIVHSQDEIAELSNLGLVFLLFMIGLELDVSELLKMGKVVIVTGMFQFPLCAAIMTGIFMGLEAAGIDWGGGDYSALYLGASCGISSTMIVVKLLVEHAEMDTAPGRLTVGILIFQDIWAIVVLAIQPDLANPEIVGLIKTFALILVLITVALLYAKFIMPAVFVFASRSIELMLIISLAWCFFLCCFATLPFIGLSMELAALISGVALATFPYSAEFNGKIKYIRDFFVTLFFVGLGMQIPVPEVGAVSKGLLVAIVVLIVRWIGIFGVVFGIGGGKRLAALSTINLSQVSEFALVICSLGMSFGHIDQDTLTVIIWTFACLAILSSYMIGYNYYIYGVLVRVAHRLAGRSASAKGDTAQEHEEGGDHIDRNIVLLGFHKIAAMLVAHFEHHEPHLLAKLHVIDFHEHIMPELRKRGVTCAYGDISSPDVLEHAHHGEVRLVISSIPDSMLRGVDNMRLLKISKQVWPSADVIVTADNPRQANELYDAGADYVLRTAKICAERLHLLISDHSTHAVHHHHVGSDMHLNNVFAAFKEKEKDRHIQTFEVTSP